MLSDTCLIVLNRKKITGHYTFKIHRKSCTGLFFKNNWKRSKLWLSSHNFSLPVFKHSSISSSFSRDPLLVTGSSKHMVRGAYEVQIHQLVCQNKVLHLSTRSTIRTGSNKTSSLPKSNNVCTVWVIHNQISNSKFNHRLTCYVGLIATWFLTCRESLFRPQTLLIFRIPAQNVRIEG